MPIRQKWWEDGEGKEIGMRNQATNKDVGLLFGMGKVLEVPDGPSINPLFSGSQASQEKFLERCSDGQGASREPSKVLFTNQHRSI